MPKTPFTHMMPNDIPLFASFFLSEEGQKFDQWEFDVRVGDGQDPGPGFAPTIRRGALAVSKLRIDAVGWRGGWPTVFEVKPEANLAAFGQIIAYDFFFLRDRGSTPFRAVITDFLKPDIKTLFDAHNIIPYVVDPASDFDVAEAERLVRPLLRK